VLDWLRPKLAEDFIAPHTSVEKPWAQVIGLEQVGIHDNFFELGGDSILSLQIVSSQPSRTASDPQGHISASNDCRISKVADTTQAIQTEQGLVTGSVPLTPMQHYFFGLTDTTGTKLSCWKCNT